MKWFRFLIAVAGVGVLGYGLYGLLSEPLIDDPLGVLTWAAGAVVLHDGVWLPVACVIGALLARDPWVRGGLIVAASLTVVALPVVLREDEDHGNASLLPLPYERNLLFLLLGCAVVTAVGSLVRYLRARRERGSKRSPAPPEDAPRP